MLEVLKEEGKDIIETVDRLNNCVEEFQKNISKKYSNKIKIIPTANITNSTRKLLNASFNNAWQGFILVFIVLIVFLDFKSAFWTAFGIPFSILLVFFAMFIMGFTINNISLFAFIIVLGMLVDNQIIVAENIFQKRELGIMGKNASINGASEVVKPILGSTLTTIAAFLPLAFIGGITGKFIFQLPIIVILALIASTIEALFILPSNLNSNKIKKNKIESRKWFIAFSNGYQKILKKALKARYLVISIFFIIFIISIMLGSKINFILFSNKDNEIIDINFKAENGISLDEMNQRMKKVETMIIQKVPYEKETDSIITQVGTSTFSSTEPGIKGKNYALIRLFLVPYNNRNKTAEEIVLEITNLLKKNNDFKEIFVRERTAGPPIGQPVEVKIISNIDNLRKQYSEEIKKFLKNQPGIFAIDDDSEDIVDEIRLKLDVNEMYRLGVNPLIVASTIRNALQGNRISSIVTQEEDIGIVVEIHEIYKKEINSLNQLLIPTFYNKQIQLGLVASFYNEKINPIIIHHNGKKTTTITAEINLKLNNPKKIMNKILDEFNNKIDQIEDLQIKIGGEGEETV